MSKADERHDINVQQYVDSLTDPTLRQDTEAIMKKMKTITGETPILYGYGTIGYGVYKYHYASGRKGEAHILAFYPRASKITVYLMDGTARYEELLQKLGKFTSTDYCLYIKRLSDIDEQVLENILKNSYQNITTLSKEKPIDSILWQRLS